MLQLVQALRYEEFVETPAKVQTGLREFLINKAVSVPTICHCLHWHLFLEKDNEDNDEVVRNFFSDIYDDLIDTLKYENETLLLSIESAIDFRNRLLKLSNFIKGSPIKKVDKRKILLQESVQEGEHSLKYFEKGITVPHEPLTKIYSVVPNKCFVFKSAVQPMKLTF